MAEAPQDRYLAAYRWHQQRVPDAIRMVLVLSRKPGHAVPGARRSSTGT